MEEKEGKNSLDSKSQSKTLNKQGQGNSSMDGNRNAPSIKPIQQHIKGQGKTGKPYREIYRPPSLRTKTSRKPGNMKFGESGPTDQIVLQRSYNATTATTGPIANNCSSNKLNGSGFNNNNKPQTSQSTNQAQTSSNGGLQIERDESRGSNSVPNSPMVSRHSFNFNNQNPNNNNPSFNVNAKEFQFAPSLQQHQQQIQNHQQLANLLSQLDPSFYENGAGALLAQSVANAAGVYSLQQSKSAGNNLNNLFLQQQIQQQLNANAGNYGNGGGGRAMQFGMNQLGYGFQNPLQQKQQQQQQQGQQQPQQQQPQICNFGPIGSGGPFNRLVQSKSSGSIATSSMPRSRVRFDDEDSDEEAYRNTMKNAESGFASMKLNGEAFMQQNQQQQQQSVPKIPSLQKSRTGFYLNMYTSPGPGNSLLSPSSPPQQGILKPQFNQPKTSGPPQQVVAIKRSRSFGSGVQTQQQPQLQPQMQMQQKGPFMMTQVHSVYSDFQISKWPKRVQEAVTAGVTAVERVAARTQIEMVNLIFNAMLNCSKNVTLDLKEGENNPEKVINEKSNNGIDADNWRNNDKNKTNNNTNETDEDSGADLTSAAVHIFLYFIQREKDRTVKESLLNTCFDTFQKLFGSNQQSGKDANKLAAQSCIFLRFLSNLYSQAKLFRRQNFRQQGQVVGQAMDEMSFTLLALLCDSCLATLRSRRSNEPYLMEALFAAMISQGRDMESTFPLKMKQLLAAVRDALLGLGPYSVSKGPLCPIVQKTLMQLIELHAANWALPASAVRYYYSNNSSNNNSTNPGKPGIGTANVFSS